ncbi:MAG: 50S ribosomal protein L23 [Chloroflexi bacterium]|nr:50S ribosomal protein L23 [Chloroflexota bacterium]
MVTAREMARILVRPVVTEKSTGLQEQGKYAFEVALLANKVVIKQAVEFMFAVDVVKVNTMRVKTKAKRFGPRWKQGRTWKKAIVTLAPGQKIPIFEGV